MEEVIADQLMVIMAAAKKPVFRRGTIVRKGLNGRFLFLGLWIPNLSLQNVVACKLQ